MLIWHRIDAGFDFAVHSTENFQFPIEIFSGKMVNQLKLQCSIS